MKNNLRVLTRRGEMVAIFFLSVAAIAAILAVEGYFKFRKVDDEKTPVFDIGVPQERRIVIQDVSDGERDCWFDVTEYQNGLKKRMGKFKGNFKP